MWSLTKWSMGRYCLNPTPVHKGEVFLNVWIWVWNLYKYMFLWEGVLVWVTVCICKCISVYHFSLSWIPTQSVLWQRLLKLSLMKGLVYGRSEYQTVLQQTAESGKAGRLSSRTSTADSENILGKGALGKWVSGSLGAKYGCCDGVSSFQLQENLHYVIIWDHQSLEKIWHDINGVVVV